MWRGQKHRDPGRRDGGLASSVGRPGLGYLCQPSEPLSGPRTSAMNRSQVFVGAREHPGHVGTNGITADQHEQPGGLVDALIDGDGPLWRKQRSTTTGMPGWGLTDVDATGTLARLGLSRGNGA